MQRKTTSRSKFSQAAFISFINKDSKINDELNNTMFETTVTNKAIMLDIVFANKTNVFDLPHDQLNTLITELTEYVFDLEKKYFVVGADDEQQIYITCLAMTFLTAAEKFGLNLNEFSAEALDHRESKQSALTRLIAFIVSLRITKEARNGSLLQTHTISEEEARNDFANLANYQSAVFSFEGLSMKKFMGKKAVDYFTLEYRHQASPLPAAAKSNVSANSIYDAISGDKPNILVQEIRSEVLRALKENLSLLKNLTRDNVDSCELPALTKKMIMDRIRRNRQVGQFPPVLVFDVISALEHEHGFQFPTDQDGNPDGSMLDTSLGWSPREMAAVAHPKIKTFTGIEPNPSPGLQGAYRKIPEFFAPGKMKCVTIINKKVEDVTTVELQLGKKQTYQFINSSPPYGVEAYYKGETFYGNEIALNALFKGIIKTQDVLEVNGVMAMNFGIVGPASNPIRNLPVMFANFVKEHSELELMTESPAPIESIAKRATTGKEFFIFARRPAHKGSIPRSITKPVEDQMNVDLMDLIEEPMTASATSTNIAIKNLKRRATDDDEVLAEQPASKMQKIEANNIGDSFETILRQENTSMRNENLFFRSENQQLREENMQLRQENRKLLEELNNKIKLQ